MAAEGRADEDEEEEGEDGAGACFGQVSRRLGRLLRRLPKSRSWSEGLRLLRRSSSSGSLTLADCSYTCHLECQGLVQLDCNQRDKQSEETASSPAARDTNVTKEEDEEEEKPKLSEEEIMTKIEEYNSKISENGMKLSPDGSYTGFIKVHLKLRRPVTVQAQSDSDPGGPGRTSFYLPNDAVKQLHISSTTTVSEVIQGLLNKFRVVDNVHKFALYQQTHCSGQDLLQKLLITEHPLYLRLVMGPNPENLSFVLKENETGEVEWDAFSVPELHNFLTILEKEESERVRQVRRRYVTYRERLLQALQDVQTKPD
ncbi:ras association domain-containing protein 5 isoform X2 [Denticeps clupeoides]|uniref:Ras association domain-containing protein 5 n=1 Tax=Denticeps clupeoides TaxID=299321 RepID=A0AAY4EEP9_9TELE|nr:ras association domain-containing protein 5 isoform X2 [Denticeps clupeoides]